MTPEEATTATRAEFTLELERMVHKFCARRDSVGYEFAAEALEAKAAELRKHTWPRRDKSQT